MGKKDQQPELTLEQAKDALIEARGNKEQAISAYKRFLKKNNIKKGVENPPAIAKELKALHTAKEDAKNAFEEAAKLVKSMKKSTRSVSKYDYPLVDGKEMTADEKKKYRQKMRSESKKADKPAREKSAKKAKEEEVEKPSKKKKEKVAAEEEEVETPKKEKKISKEKEETPEKKKKKKIVQDEDED